MSTLMPGQGWPEALHAIRNLTSVICISDHTLTVVTCIRDVGWDSRIGRRLETGATRQYRTILKNHVILLHPLSDGCHRMQTVDNMRAIMMAQAHSLVLCSPPVIYTARFFELFTV